MSRPIPIDEEIVLDPKEYIYSTTDTKGIIRYGNKYFTLISGYDFKELINQPHNILRHPDMPRVAFKLMWETIQKGGTFVGLVKNLARSGKYYWVLAEIAPIKDKDSGEIVGYAAYRRAAPKEAVAKIIPIYKELVRIEKENNNRMVESEKYLQDTLASLGMTYDEFIKSITKLRGITALFFELMKKFFEHKKEGEKINNESR